MFQTAKFPSSTQPFPALFGSDVTQADSHTFIIPHQQRADPQALIVPLFREFRVARLINTYWALMPPQVPAPIAVFIFKKFFDGVPISLKRAAEVFVFLLAQRQIVEGVAALALK